LETLEEDGVDEAEANQALIKVCKAYLNNLSR